MLINPADHERFFMNEFVEVILIDECICHGPQNYKSQSIVMNMKYKHPGIYYIQFKSSCIFLRTSAFLNQPNMPYKLFRGLRGTYQRELSNHQCYLYKKGHQQLSSLNLTEFSSSGPDEFSSESFAHILGLFSF